MQLNSTFCVVTNGNKRKIPAGASSSLKKANLTPIHLGPIDVTYQKDLACRFLGVHALDIDIEQIIHSKSKGNPGWMKRLLKSLLEDGLIRLRRMKAQDAEAQGYTLAGSSVKIGNLFTMDEISAQALHFCRSGGESHMSQDAAMIDGKQIINVAILSTDCDINTINFEEIEDGAFVHFFIHL